MLQNCGKIKNANTHLILEQNDQNTQLANPRWETDCYGRPNEEAMIGQKVDVKSSRVDFKCIIQYKSA